MSQADGINLVPCLGVCDDDRDEILGHMTASPPVLSKSKDKVGCGGLGVDKGIVLESGTEVTSVVEDLGADLLFERLGQFSRRAATVDHSAAERCDIDVTIGCLDENTTSHGIEDVTSAGLRVVVGENNVLCLRGSKESDHLLVLLPRGRGRERVLRGEDSAAIFAV